MNDKSMDLKEAFISALKKSSCCHKHICESIDILIEKLRMLQSTGRYQRLLKDILRCNDMANMKALVAESTFAHKFESKSKKLEYEVKQQENHNGSSVDFLWKLPDLHMNVYFEFRLISERTSESKMEPYEQSEITRPQSIILSKCQNVKGQIIKFNSKDKSAINIIVIDNSSGIYGMFDQIDCQLAAYGDRYVESVFRRGFFGLFEKEISATSTDQKDFNQKYSKLRSIIHGVLFLKRLSPEDPANFNYAYYLTPNYLIFNKSRAKSFVERLSQIITPWQDR